MRAFVAVKLSDEVRRALSEVIARMRGFDLPVKWVESQNLHLTLKFLGEIRDEAAQDAVAILHEEVQSAAPFELRLTGAGAFPGFHRPRVLFVETEDEPPVTEALARRLNDAMVRLGVPREVRPFRKHITLGRMRRPQPLGRAAEELRALIGSRSDPMQVREVVLMRSHLTPAGPIYDVVSRAPLGGPYAK